MFKLLQNMKKDLDAEGASTGASAGASIKNPQTSEPSKPNALTKFFTSDLFDADQMVGEGLSSKSSKKKKEIQTLLPPEDARERASRESIVTTPPTRMLSELKTISKDTWPPEWAETCGFRVPSFEQLQAYIERVHAHMMALFEAQDKVSSYTYEQYVAELWAAEAAGHPREAEGELTTLSTMWKHVADDDVAFHPPPDRHYTYKGVRQQVNGRPISVSSISSFCSLPFDEKAVIGGILRRCKFHRGDHYGDTAIAYIASQNPDASESATREVLRVASYDREWNTGHPWWMWGVQAIKRDWKARREGGDHMHHDIQCVYEGHAPKAPPTPELVRLFLTFQQTWVVPRGWIPWAVEKIIIYPPLNLCGSVDAIVLDPCTGNLIVIDWKRYEKQPMPENLTSYSKACLPPLEHMQDTKVVPNLLQLSLYKFMLSSPRGPYNLPVSDLLLVCLHPNKSKPNVTRVPDMTADLHELMEAWCKQQADIARDRNDEDTELIMETEAAYHRGLWQEVDAKAGGIEKRASWAWGRSTWRKKKQQRLQAMAAMYKEKASSNKTSASGKGGNGKGGGGDATLDDWFLS
jgi:hypothetical protein